MDICTHMKSFFHPHLLRNGKKSCVCSHFFNLNQEPPSKVKKLNSGNKLVDTKIKNILL